MNKELVELVEELKKVFEEQNKRIQDLEQIVVHQQGQLDFLERKSHKDTVH